MLATSAWFFAYLVFSVPSAKLIEKVGYKRTMVISLFIMVAGALLFVPAANQVSFPLTLAAIFVLATGVMRIADLGQSLYVDSGAGAQRLGAVESGAGVQLLGLGDCALGCGAHLSSPIPASASMPAERGAHAGRGLISPLLLRCCCWALR